MKKIVVSTLAVLMACPAFAGTQSRTSDWQLFGLNPYIGLRGGLGYTNQNYSFNGDKKSMTDMVWQGRAALGLEICDTARTEVEWSIFSLLGIRWLSRCSSIYGTGRWCRVLGRETQDSKCSRTHQEPWQRCRHGIVGRFVRHGIFCG